MTFFNDWESLLRILVIGVAGYIGLITILRVSGSRVLSQMSDYDFIITVAIGSAFATAILDSDVALADTLLAFVVLAGLQYLTTFLTVRSKIVHQLLKEDPILLFYKGRFLFDDMKKANVNQNEVFISMRQQGFGSIDEVGFVVLETNGKIIAVGKGDDSTLNLPVSKSS